MLKLDEPVRNKEIFIISLSLIVQTWVLRVKFFIFADPDPGSQNLADPTDPDPVPRGLRTFKVILEFFTVE